MNANIKLLHGNGGSHSMQFIEEVIYKHFYNPILLKGLDGAVFDVGQERMVFTTDSFVVKPLFFPGGDIGKLAVCGTVNDLAVAGAMPLYLSCGLIIEEGFPMKELEKILASMGEMAHESGVQIVTGDTKVVEKNAVDGLYINTTGIGRLRKNYFTQKIVPGDRIILSGTLGEHGTVIAIERYNLKVQGNFSSDCAPVYHMIHGVSHHIEHIKLMKDPTRGGVASALYEIAKYADLGIHLMEENLPIRHEVALVNELLGMDPLYLACEGRVLLVVEEGKAEEVLYELRQIQDGQNAQIIGGFVHENEKLVFLENGFGGKRILPPLTGEMLPRIC